VSFGGLGFAFPLRHDEGFVQANFPFPAWPDLSPPSAFMSLLAEVFPGAWCQVSLLPLAKDEPPPIAAADFLRPDELGRWQSFTSDKRKREWLGGRLCAYDCARRLTAQSEEPFQTRNWWLAADENGRPCWQGNVPPALRDMDISLSHGGAYALALVAPGCAGVDVEACRGKVERVAAQFCHQEEEDSLTRLMPEQDRLVRLTLLWAAKESLRKAATGLPGFLAMSLSGGYSMKAGWRLTLAWKAGCQATVAAMPHDGHAFAFCLLEK